MAKELKKETEMSVADKLKTLFDLQTKLSEIDKIKTLRGELPLEVQDLEDEIEGLTARVARLNDEKAEANAYIRETQSSIEVANASIARYKEQIDNVRNNREYDTLSKEIEYQQLDIELSQKHIREAQEDVKERDAQIADSKHEIEELKNDLVQKRSELDDIITETKAQEEKLREEAQELEERIEPRLLTSFKRIRKNSHNGLGIVYVDRDACGGCFNKIPPQRQLDIRMHKKIIVCEYCGRILIDPELAGVEVAKPVEEEKPKRRSTRKKAVATKAKEEAVPEAEA